MNTVMFPRVAQSAWFYAPYVGIPVTSVFFFSLLLSLTALLGECSPFPEVLLDIQQKSSCSLATLGVAWEGHMAKLDQSEAPLGILYFLVRVLV